MKPNFYSKLACLLLTFIWLTGCQEDGIAPSGNPISYRSHDCTATCIDPDAPVYHEEDDFIVETAGPNFRRFDYTVYNTLSGFVVDWVFSASTPTPRRLTVQVSGAGFTAPITYTTTCAAAPNSGSHTFVFDADWAACGLVSFTVKLEDCAGLLKESKAGSYALVGECITCDEASFSYATANNLDISFTYNAGEETGALEDAVVAFTFPQVVNLPLNEDGLFVAPDGKLYTVNNPTNQTVFTWIGDIGCTAETATTFVFSHTPDCSAPPANDGKANIWTDMTVNGVSVKGESSNIVYTGCQ